MIQLTLDTLTLLGTAAVVMLGLNAIQHMDVKTNHLIRLAYCVATTMGFFFVVAYMHGDIKAEPLYFMMSLCCVLAMVAGGRGGVTFEHLWHR